MPREIGIAACAKIGSRCSALDGIKNGALRANKLIKITFHVNAVHSKCSVSAISKGRRNCDFNLRLPAHQANKICKRPCKGLIIPVYILNEAKLCTVSKQSFQLQVTSCPAWPLDAASRRAPARRLIFGIVPGT